MTSGKLYVVATPIGNLSDMSPRQIETLREADLIAAEDTRNSRHLLEHFQIRTPMTSYHHFNRVEKADELIDKLRGGMKIALITDAGTPAISDPGQELVDICHREGIGVEPIPGPAACITALSASGLESRRFVFEGFLPRDKKEKREVLEEIKGENKTMIFYEAPHRLIACLRELSEALGAQRKAMLAHELTKRHESLIRGTLAGLIDHYAVEAPKGEFVIVVEGRSREEIKAEQKARWEEMTIPDHVAYYEERGMERKEAMKAAARDRHLSKSDIYRELIN